MRVLNSELRKAVILKIGEEVSPHAITKAAMRLGFRKIRTNNGRGFIIESDIQTAAYQIAQELNNNSTNKKSKITTKKKEVDQLMRFASSCYTYMITNSREEVKIGKSQNPYARLQSLLTGDPSCELLAIVPKNIESSLHTKLNKYRIASNKEWFKLSDQVIVDTINEFGFTLIQEL